MLPNFIVIGAMKGGTTSLWQYLKSHPQIYLPAKKEIHFFSYEENWAKGAGWYQEFFAEAPRDAIAIGEASTTYAKHPLIEGVPERIAAVLPNVRLIYLLRNPIDRMRSHYLDRHQVGEEDAPIERALLSDDRYLNLSRYAMQIDRYLEYFNLEQFLFLTSEELRGQRRATIQRVFGFLGVDTGWESPVFHEDFYRADTKRNYGPVGQALRRSPLIARVAHSAPEGLRRLNRRVAMHAVAPSNVTLSDDLRSRLEAALRDDVRHLRGYLGPNFDGWGIA